MDCNSIFQNWFIAFGTLALGVAAVLGIIMWKREITFKRKSDIAENILKLLENTKWKILEIRADGYDPEEARLLQMVDKESGITQRRISDIYRKRFDRLSLDIKKIKDISVLSKMFFDKKLYSYISDFIILINELDNLIKKLEKTSDLMFIFYKGKETNPDYNKQMKVFTELNEEFILYNNEDARINELIDKIYLFFDKTLKLK